MSWRAGERNIRAGKNPPWSVVLRGGPSGQEKSSTQRYKRRNGDNLHHGEPEFEVAIRADAAKIHQQEQG